VSTQDLWHIGKAIGLPEFDDTNDWELEEMNKALAHAKREDEKEQKATDEEKLHDQMQPYIEGRRELEQTKARTQFTSALWVRKIWEKYRGAVIRRTVNSLDYTGQAIAGLEPYEQHTLFGGSAAAI
jgi:hypothetical protein